MKVKCGNIECKNTANVDTPGKKSAHKKGHKIFCSDDCRYLVKLERARAWNNARRIPPKERKCRYCGTVFMPIHKSQKYCPPPKGEKGCQYRAAIKRNRGYSYSERKNKIKSGRKCVKCGFDPYPNYYWCKQCHHDIDDTDHYNRGMI